MCSIPKVITHSKKIAGTSSNIVKVKIKIYCPGTKSKTEPSETETTKNPVKHIGESKTDS